MHPNIASKLPCNFTPYLSDVSSSLQNAVLFTNSLRHSQSNAEIALNLVRLYVDNNNNAMICCSGFLVPLTLCFLLGVDLCWSVFAVTM